MRHHDFGEGRYAVRLDPGEEVVASLRAFADEQGITAGFATGLGSFDDVLLGFLDPATNEYVKRRFEERMEVGHLTATFSLSEERPFVHVHAVVSPRELLAYAGHVHRGTVGAVMELYVVSVPGRMERRPVPGLPFPGLFLPGEEPPEETPPA